jgi:mannosylglucosylglycerate synthase
MPDLASRRIGFISTRFAGTDGVSLETEKWATVLQQLGHTCYYFSGLSDRPAEVSRVVPEAFFGHPDIDAISDAVFQTAWGTPDLAEYANPSLKNQRESPHSYRIRPPAVTRRIDELADLLKAHIYQFTQDFKLDLLIIENASTIPMNVPLGIAIAEFIAETGFSTIAHHHDFHWERQRFLITCISDYLEMAFPPTLPSIQHVVINSVASQQLAFRTGISATLIPNVMDFENPPPPPDAYTVNLRDDLQVGPGELLFLQPTRVVQRKGIEHAIELVKRLGYKTKLIISHASGDEGNDYEKRIREFAAMLDVPVNFVADIIQDDRGLTPDGRKIYTLQDVYNHADMVTYPSSIEGFGNAFLEAVYFKRPIVVNNYSIFDADIKPKGFQVIEFDGFIADSTVRFVQQVLERPALRQAMTEENYHLAHRYYSYAVLRRHLQTLIANIFGEDHD